MNKEITKVWDYEESVKKIRPKVLRLKTLTIEIVQELYTARQELDGRGGDRKSYNYKSKVKNFTFENYCEDIGVTRQTGYNWLERYIPEEQKLLTTEEYQEKKKIDEKQKQKQKEEEYYNQTQRIIQFKRTGIKPDGWDEKTDELRMKKEEDEKAYQERKRNIIEEKEQEKPKYTTEELIKASEKHIKKLEERSNLFDKIRITDKDDNILHVLLQYLDALPEQRRIETCHNIIKVCKNVVNQLQVKFNKGA